MRLFYSIPPLWIKLVKRVGFWQKGNNTKSLKRWYNKRKGGVSMSIKEKKRTNNGQTNMSPQERSVLKRYGVLKKADNKRKARTINELYDQRYKIKNH